MISQKEGDTFEIEKEIAEERKLEDHAEVEHQKELDEFYNDSI